MAVKTNLHALDHTPERHHQVTMVSNYWSLVFAIYSCFRFTISSISWKSLFHFHLQAKRRDDRWSECTVGNPFSSAK